MTHNNDSINNIPLTNEKIPITFLPELQQATGRYDYPMTNDYIFRAVLQTNNLALKGLISALLRIPPEHILSVEITNPILLGDHYEAKEFRLDINVLLNNHARINLEMQVVYQSDWRERSLLYICRSLDSLSHGEDYENLKPAIHIGILDKAPTSEGNEFYSEHMVMNVKSHEIYSDKLSLRVLRLDCIDNATAEDKAWKIDCWAKLFNATTWEELKMIAHDNEYLTAASNSIFTQNADEIARKRAQDREDYYRDVRRWQRQIEEQKAELAKKDASLAENKQKYAALQDKNTALQDKNTTLQNENTTLQNENTTLQNENTALQDELSALRAKLAQYESQS